ncbi:hypothetical protein CK203_015716 [Vitis vinifera]|uniref:Uncharacterized protein n=1 Tax=Vitis vinifera TaxID=29760 RepID=A0A438J518_VITVI|nr:hypothetical protein CK203_015716 [Vitis vinifera]
MGWREKIGIPVDWIADVNERNAYFYFYKQGLTAGGLTRVQISVEPSFFLITTTTTIFAILPPHSATNPWWCGPLSTIIRFPPSKLRPLSSSSSSTSVSVVEEGEVGEAPFF